MKKSNQEDKTIFKNLRRLYIFGFLTIALIIIISQILVYYKLEAARQSEAQYWIFGFILFVLFLEFFFIFKLTNTKIERLVTTHLSEKEALKLKYEAEIVHSQENERNRIAKEIHDGIGQMLTGLKFSLESIDLENKEKSAQKIDHLKKLSFDIIKGVRTAIFNLIPPELNDHGIASSLEKFTQDLSKLTEKEILFYNKTNFGEHLDSSIKINIYRLTQEAINNAIKHSESSQIKVQLSHSENLLSIMIEDNGKGFDSESVEKNRSRQFGIGLLFMKERIQHINGQVFIISIPGEGTKITFNIPI